MTAIASTLLPAAVQAGGALLSSKLSEKKGGGGLGNFNPTGFSGGGLKGSFNNGRFEVGPSQSRLDRVGSIARTFPEQAQEISNIRKQFIPGLGRLTQTRLGLIGNARDRAIGNLRENLSRRRVLGSSFAGDALSRAELEFAQEQDRVQQEALLQELEVQNNLINQEFDLKRGEFQTFLSEMNLSADIASKLSQGATQVLAQNAQLKEKLNAEEAKGTGQFFGQMSTMLGNRLGNFVSGLGRNGGFDPSVAAAAGAGAFNG